MTPKKTEEQTEDADACIDDGAASSLLFSSYEPTSCLRAHSFNFHSFRIFDWPSQQACTIQRG